MEKIVILNCEPVRVPVVVFKEIMSLRKKVHELDLSLCEVIESNEELIRDRFEITFDLCEN